jgi:apolipoprotein N-acyltransferase
VELTGVLGVVFLVVSINMGAADLLARPDDRRQHLVTVLVLMTIAVAGNGLPQLRTTKKGPKVAAIGWTEADVHGPAYSRNTHRIYEGLFLPMFRRAVATEAELIVAPEMTFRVRKAQRRRLFARLRELTRTHRVTLVVGYILADKKENRAVCFGPKGNILADYQKTHLVPYIEKLNPGPGKTTPISLRSKGAGNNSRPLKLGVMICQDDNFTDVARAYGRAGTQIMAVPTNDWRQVKDHHFENSLFRAVENRYAIVRAASNGISALISPRGRVLARVDHFEKGPTVIAARLPVMSPSATLYSLAGDWPAALSAALLVVGFVVFRRRQE